MCAVECGALNEVDGFLLERRTIAQHRFGIMQRQRAHPLLLFAAGTRLLLLSLLVCVVGCQRHDQQAEQQRECGDRPRCPSARQPRSEEHTSELQSLMRISYAVFCLKKNKYKLNFIHTQITNHHSIKYIKEMNTYNT